jgi:Ca2+-binding EF-hand superfamily protein
VQDLVFFSDTRPVFIRLHVFVNGKPFQTVWDEYIDSLFQYLDVNGDGVLSKEEAQRAPSPQALLQLLQGNLGVINPRPATRVRTPELVVSLSGGKVTKKGLASYYRLSGIYPCLAIGGQSLAQPGGFPGGQYPASQGDALTDALFRHLDLNKDGKLSKEELLAAPVSLGKLDQDDDELISPQELLPIVSNPLTPPAIPVAMAATLPESSPFWPLREDDPPGTLAGQLTERLLRHYDRDKNEKLSRAEIGLDKAVFDRLDANHDGELDAEELGKLLQQPPDLELILRLGDTPGNRPAAEIVNPNGRPGPLSGAVRQSDAGAVVLTLGDAEIDLRLSPAGSSAAMAQNLRQTYVRQFQAADTEKVGFVDMRKAQQNPLLRSVFASADRDGDGKLTEKELLTYLELQGKAVACSTILSVADQGRGLFEILDANQDGFLGVRELRSAWSRLAHWDRDGDGCIAKEEIPRRFLLTLGQGRAGFGVRAAVVVQPAMDGMRPRPTAPARGPLWFRKMDRNGDGDVSPREFLGTPEDFKRIDTDGDGLIDADEAERADAWFRSRVPQER